MVRYPQALDVLLPIVDGWTPICTADLTIYYEAIARIEDVMGYGASFGSGSFGPKAGNAHVRARLDAFLEPNGGLRDVAFMNGTMRIGDFYEESQFGGAYFGFPKTMSHGGVGLDGYAVLFETVSPGMDEGDGSVPPVRDIHCPALWWVDGARTAVGCKLKARTLNGVTIAYDEDNQVTYAMLVVGYDAYV